ncbi:hypothetical protein NRI_0786 [Neorickettsia risticii str. Illinois]|uniref:Uncharacterized protein n=1 Tax=Neorickettsia risticii (strain Illinois) TaxID=434131 RepID=C6V5U1_NEORI|nr:hypothetical protein NRI_0786 [Neorickettsia risticii str. Illinois]
MTTLRLGTKPLLFFRCVTEVAIDSQIPAAIPKPSMSCVIFIEHLN